MSNSTTQLQNEITTLERRLNRAKLTTALVPDFTTDGYCSVGVNAVASPSIHINVRNIETWRYVRRAFKGLLKFSAIQIHDEKYHTCRTHAYSFVGPHPFKRPPYVYLTLEPGDTCRKVKIGTKQVDVYELVCE